MNLPAKMLVAIFLFISPFTYANKIEQPIYIVNPAYPGKAYAEKVDADVKVQYDINEYGEIINYKIISISPERAKGMHFEETVIWAIKQWIYPAGKLRKGVVKNIKFRIHK